MNVIKTFFFSLPILTTVLWHKLPTTWLILNHVTRCVPILPRQGWRLADFGGKNSPPSLEDGCFCVINWCHSSKKIHMRQNNYLFHVYIYLIALRHVFKGTVHQDHGYKFSWVTSDSALKYVVLFMLSGYQKDYIRKVHWWSVSFATIRWNSLPTW